MVAARIEAIIEAARAGTYKSAMERRIDGHVGTWINELMVRNNPDAKWTPPLHDLNEISNSIDEALEFEGESLDDDTRRAVHLGESPSCASSKSACPTFSMIP